MNDKLRQEVYERANGCCEYCQTCEVNTGQVMQIDHIIPNNDNSLDNLCLSCWNGILVSGITPVGRATILRLKMNRPTIMVARQRWIESGYHPPK